MIFVDIIIFYEELRRDRNNPRQGIANPRSKEPDTLARSKILLRAERLVPDTDIKATVSRQRKKNHYSPSSLHSSPTVLAVKDEENHGC